MARPRPPVMLACGHFAAFGTDCGICAEQRAVARLSSPPPPITVEDGSRPDPTSATATTVALSAAPAAGVTEGLVYDLPEAEYHAHPALSSSGARLLIDPSCPALFRHAMDNPEPPSTEALALGSAYHSLAFGVGAEVVEIPAELLARNGAISTAAAKEFVDLARKAGHIPLKAGQIETLRAMAEVLRSDPLFRAATATGQPEVSFFWEDLHGVECRGRADWLPSKGRRLIVLDLKTSISAHPATFARKSAVDRGYAQQADWYLRGLRELGVADDRSAFIFLVQEKTAPYVVQAIQFDREDMQVGQILNDRAIETYARCVESGQWPGYHEGVAVVSLPAFYKQPILEGV